MRRVELALVACVALGLAACHRDPPRLAVRALPSRAAGAGVEARFELRNTGGTPLALSSVVAACGCAPASSLPDALAPGTAAMLDVRCRAPRGADAVRTLQLRTNDP